MITNRKSILSAIAATAIVASSMVYTASSAQAANKFVKGFVAGAIAGAIINGATRSHAHGRGYSECWYERQKRWDQYGNPFWVRVKICD